MVQDVKASGSRSHSHQRNRVLKISVLTPELMKKMRPLSHSGSKEKDDKVKTRDLIEAKEQTEVVTEYESNNTAQLGNKVGSKGLTNSMTFAVSQKEERSQSREERGRVTKREFNPTQS